MSGKLLVIATPLGNLSDLSPRAERALREADCIACEDTRRTARLLSRFEIDRPLISCHKFNEKQRLEPILERLAAGETVALVSDAGTPGIADPGALLVREAVEAGHPPCPIPGPSALTAMLSVSGCESGRFVFDGFLPHRGGERRRRLRELKAESRPIVFYESPHRIVATLQDVEAILGGRRLALGRELTKIHETILFGSAAELRSALGDSPKGEFVVVIDAASAEELESPDGDDAASQLRSIWREELTRASGDRRLALRATARRSGIKRAEAYRQLSEIGEPVDG